MKQKLPVKDLLTASYQSQHDAQTALAKHGFGYDPQLSNMENKVFIDPFGKPHIAYRGSRTLKDFIVNDSLIGLGLGAYAPRVIEGKHIAKMAESKYGQAPNAYGNSLGGYIAERSGTSGDIVTHNKPVTLHDIGKRIPANQTDIRTINDPVSALAITQRHSNPLLQTPARENWLAAHSVENAPVFI